MVNVLWLNQSIEGATWEVQEDMQTRYPHLFSASSNQVEGTILLIQFSPNQMHSAVWLFPLRFMHLVTYSRVLE